MGVALGGCGYSERSRDEGAVPAAVSNGRYVN